MLLVALSVSFFPNIGNAQGSQIAQNDDEPEKYVVAIDHSAKYRVTVTWDVKNTNSDKANQLLLYYYNSRYSDEDSVSGCHCFINILNIEEPAKTKGINVRSFDLEGPPSQITYKNFGSVKNKTEFYVKKVEVEQLSHIKDTGIDKKFTLWEGTFGMANAHFLGSENSSELHFNQGSAGFTDWWYTNIGSNRTQETTSYYSAFPRQPRIQGVVDDIKIHENGREPVDVIYIPEDDKSCDYVIEPGTMYDSYGSPWPSQTANECLVTPEDKSVSVYCTGNPRTFHLRILPEANPVEEYTLHIKTQFQYVKWTAERDIPVKILPTFEGEGTEESPYLIRTEQDWETLRLRTRYSDTAGKVYRLENDLSVSTMIGEKSDSFRGIFDGNDKTLTVEYTNESDSITAPFAGVDGATIRNLTVNGEIRGSGHHAAGLLGECIGNTTVKNCTVSASISGRILIAGMCVCAGGKLVIDSSSFTGFLDGMDECAGFVARGNKYLILKDCLLDPAKGSHVRKGASFVYGDYDRIENCYYTTPLGVAQGMEYGKTPESYQKEYSKTVKNAKSLSMKKFSANPKKGRKVYLYWQRNKDADGYQVSCSTNSKFKKWVKTVDINDVKTLKQKIQKLKAGKTYYVKARTIKYVTNETTGKKKTVYGKWSKVLKFICKK